MSIGTLAGKAVLSLRKHSPTILFVAGVASTTASTVVACRATLRVNEIIEHAEKEYSKIALMEGSNHADYSTKDAENDRRIVKVQTAVKFTKTYAPAVVLGVVGVACLTKSHRILIQRNNALMAAYAILEGTLKNYRERVAEKLGEEKEAKLYRESLEKSMTEKNEEGKVQKRKQTGRSPYARFFDETNRNWEPNPSVNIAFLRLQQNWANDRLRARGHIFLNEVYDHMGYDRTTAGAIVGWKVGNGGDDFVDFGLDDGDTRERRAFVNGLEAAFLLDFNVDGVIYKSIED